MNFVDSYRSLGVMRRDRKPENFLFSGKDEMARLKAIDFGLSTYIYEGKLSRTYLFHACEGSFEDNRKSVVELWLFMFAYIICVAGGSNYSEAYIIY